MDHKMSNTEELEHVKRPRVCTGLADPGGHAAKGAGMWPRVCGFESS